MMGEDLDQEYREIVGSPLTEVELSNLNQVLQSTPKSVNLPLPGKVSDPNQV